MIIRIISIAILTIPTSIIIMIIVPDSLLQLSGVSADRPNLANQLHNAKALLVKCPGTIATE